MAELRSVRRPRAGSKIEETFALQLRIYRIPVVREYRFHMARRWRFDFAFPTRRLAVEIEGLVRGGRGRHQTVAGFTADVEKYNTAASMGWTVLRFTSRMVLTGRALEVTRGMLASLQCMPLVPNPKPTGGEVGDQKENDMAAKKAPAKKATKKPAKKAAKK